MRTLQTILVNNPNHFHVFDLLQELSIDCICVGNQGSPRPEGYKNYVWAYLQLPYSKRKTF